MQYSQHPAPPPSFPSFKRHRADLDPHKFKVSLTLPTPLPPPVWASLPSPPMSGSPPPEQPSSPHQIAGRRRKRSDSPPPATNTVSSAPPAISQQGPSSYAGYPPARYSTSQVSSGLPSYPPPQPMAYAVGPPVPAPVPSPSTQHFPGGPVSPRTTRKNKAHVASACINCKKKHLRCDNARPCRRCVQSGKEDTCEDVVHKKRGRPPLRPEDTARRSYDPGLLVGGPRRMSTTDPASYAQGGQYSRPFRPLQAQPPYDPTRTQYRPGQHYGLYASPVVGPSTATAMGQFAPPRSYGPPTGVQPHASWPGAAASPAARPLAPYPPTYDYSGEPMRPPPPTGYSTALFPRNQLPLPTSEQTGSAGVSTSLQLPPIRSAGERPPIDPSLASPEESRPQEYQHDLARGGNGTNRQPNSKRPKMDIQGILGPRHD